MNRYLFLFTIGPVQSFIAQARKTQDLYAGSTLLSDLTDCAISEAKEKYIANIRFPSQNIKSKPNRFLAEIEAEDIELVGSGIESVVRDKFSKLANEKFENKSNSAKPSSFDDQIDNFLDIHWVLLPFNDGEYTEKYEEIEKLLGSIKNVRKFKQIKNGEGEIGRKCSLCGERNVLFCENKRIERGNKEISIKDSLKVKPNWNSLSAEERKVVNCNNNCIVEIDNPFALSEGLCAICFIKRFYKQEEKEFPSTAEIALMHQIGEGDIRDYKLDQKNSKLDPQLFYEENLTERYFKKYNIRDNLKTVTDKRNEILEKKGLKPSELIKYYALVMMDGDNMGKWLSGEYLSDKGDLDEFQNKLSKSLGEYADMVSGKIIKDSEGKLVYAGGDDVLAFINLNHLLPVIRELRDDFPEFEELGVDIKDNQKSSASAGVVIAHYKTPLSEVLNWARRMEKEAKDKGGRDAFSIAILKRSGGISKISLKWRYDDFESTVVMDDLVELLKAEKFSNKFINTMNIELRQLMDKDTGFEDSYIDTPFIETEMKRLIARSCMILKEDGEDTNAFNDRKKEEIDKVAQILYRLYKNSKTLDNFLSILKTVDFIKRVEKGGD